MPASLVQQAAKPAVGPVSAEGRQAWPQQAADKLHAHLKLSQDADIAGEVREDVLLHEETEIQLPSGRQLRGYR